MSSPASIKNHPIHPMLVGLPIGLWVFALVCDCFRLAGEGPAWGTAAIYCVAGGIVGAILAAVPGLIDYFSITDPETGRIATYHMFLNLSAVVIFVLNLWLRFRLPEAIGIQFACSLVGVALIGVGGWLGGEMVYVKGMAVQAVEDQARKDQAKKEQKSRSAA